MSTTTVTCYGSPVTFSARPITALDAMSVFGGTSAWHLSYNQEPKT